MSAPDADPATVTSEVITPPQRPSGHPRQFACPNCGGVIKVTAVGHTVSVVCQHCSSVLDAAHESVRILTEAHEATRPTLIEMGTRGVLRDIEWEAIGFMTRKDKVSGFHWDEYLLFNPFHGFRFLVQADGHWTLARILKEDIGATGNSGYLWYGTRSYRQASSGEAVVSYVKGEFYWRVAVGETWRTSDYACAPYFLSVERNDQEINLSAGEYLEPEEVCNAFGLTGTMPEVFGVAAHQPNRMEVNLRRILKIAIAAFVAAITIQMVTFSLATNAKVIRIDTDVRVADKDKTYTSNEFVVPKSGNLKIECSSPIVNDWVELELSLVNTKTGEEFAVNEAFEYYVGQDEDGGWSEGSNQTEAILSAIPAGNYRLLVDMDSGVFGVNKDLRLIINVTNDVGEIYNILIVLALLAIYPLIEFYRYWRFEKLRWADSE